MKITAALTLLATAGVMAAPADLDERQFGGSSTRTDLEDGNSSDCPSTILIFARATGERGNIGGSTGPALTGSLEREFRDIWVQGVGGPYDASTADNLLPKGTSQAAIDEAVRLFNMANQKCPQASVVTGGYSQGTAVIAGALPELSAAAKEQVKGAVLFGYTKNQQNDERIPDYPTERTSIFCNRGDLVCEGTLILAAPHFAYTGVARGDAADFLIDRVNA
ncbi:Cutinase-like protein [Hapsidospora chrysogenum ATCC 11550]|uniref:Cutinase n=1 Tax=Hapsidospora chrysogenum (strain ATCC 11550 / CBS 779.69 / DSM 880 / IAM 14645 / JCM 23072 / IMI 49137) TaxID=857340 RepID=A0A086TG01_HAPC1|nr:Cutinase-like protein [Hapsidospora chrysogenum ATCC 11550]